LKKVYPLRGKNLNGANYEKIIGGEKIRRKMIGEKAPGDGRYKEKANLMLNSRGLEIDSTPGCSTRQEGMTPPRGQNLQATT